MLISVEITPVVCPTCGVAYAIPENYRAQLDRDKNRGDTRCPNGHSWSYLGEREEDIQRRKRHEAEAAYQSTMRELDKTQRKVVALQRQIDRMKATTGDKEP